jgi:probable selenium-dependent hydroxylase accessory protein YqeC
MKIKDALNLQEREVISLVGGGGKTTLMFALAKELADEGLRVVTTTTTKIMAPALSDTEAVVLSKDEKEIIRQVKIELNSHLHITLAREKLASGKLSGVTPETIIDIAQLTKISHIIIEADGAAHHSLKAPAEHEPVIPPNTSLVIAVVGLDVLGKRLDENAVFRAVIAAKLLGIPLGAIISPEVIGGLVASPHGITKGCPPGIPIVAFLNKIDAINLIEGHQVAQAILAMSYPKIATVILGQTRALDPVIEVITR